MSKESLLKQFKQDVKNIKKKARELGVNDEQVTNILKESFDEFARKEQGSKLSNKLMKLAQKLRRNVLKCCTVLIVCFSLSLYVLLHVHTPTSSIVLRNVQGLTYPALKVVRTLSVPFIKLFPSLTDLYDESCLVENPYFYVNDMECWPCENVHSVIDLTGLEELNSFTKIGEGTPFIAKGKQNAVSWKDLQILYSNFTNELNSDSRRLKTSNKNVKDLKSLFNTDDHDLSSNIHIQWRINKMTAARIIRKLFPKPYFLPERSGQAVERFLIVDSPESEPYNLPNTECSYVFIIQGSGERTINLKPSKECKNTCKPVSVVLKPTYILLYNWWYWRPVSLPSKNATNLSISYINSYC